MALEDITRSLREFDIASLDFENVGSWPVAVKVAIWGLLLIAVLVGGYYYHIKDLQAQLAQVEGQELELKKDFEKKAFQAANLEAYRQQMVEMEESFGALVSQLPSDTEVPGLLEDITNKGLLNGLEIASIQLQKEAAREFYVEFVSRPGRFYQWHGGVAAHRHAA
jgi:type IV pilus assembly protein PilO